MSELTQEITQQVMHGRTTPPYHTIQLSNHMETSTHTAPPVALDRLVRLCRFCAQKLDLWMEWKSNHCLYDHATSMPCDECQGANLRNPESIFTVKFRLPNSPSACSPSSGSCPHCNGWGIEPNDDFSPCRAGCSQAPELEQINAIIKDVTADLFSSENSQTNQPQVEI